MTTHHFLSLLDLSAADLRALITRASELKAERLDATPQERQLVPPRYRDLIH